MKWAVRFLVLVVGFFAVVGLMSLSAWQGWSVSRQETPQLAAQLTPSFRYFVPEGAGPFPTVLQFHGCGSAQTNQDEWGAYFASQGYAAVVVDSLTPRGIGRIEAVLTVCTAVQLTSMERAGDIIAALRQVRSLPFVDDQRLYLAGWSHGGWSIMDLMSLDLTQTTPPNLMSASPADLGGIRGAALIYPYCGFPSSTTSNGWQRDLPTYVIMGDEDTVAPARPCLAAIDRLSTDGISIEHAVYEGAGHDFDVSGHEVFHQGTYLEEETNRARTEVISFFNGLR